MSGATVLMNDTFLPLASRINVRRHGTTFYLQSFFAVYKKLLPILSHLISAIANENGHYTVTLLMKTAKEAEWEGSGAATPGAGSWLTTHSAKSLHLLLCLRFLICHVTR